MKTATASGPHVWRPVNDRGSKVILGGGNSPILLRTCQTLWAWMIYVLDLHGTWNVERTIDMDRTDMPSNQVRFKSSSRTVANHSKYVTSYHAGLFEAMQEPFDLGSC